MAIKIWGAGSGAGSDGQWDTANNWSGNTAPVNGDSILFDGTSVNALITGPSSDVTIVNFTINASEAVSGGYSFNGGVVYLTGNMTNNSTAFNNFTLGGAGFEGVTGVVGKWKSDYTFSRVTDVTYGNVLTFEIANLIFDNNNSIEFANVGGFGFQSVTICRPDIGAGVRPFQSFTLSDLFGGGSFFYNFNFQKTRLLTEIFNMNDAILNITGNDLLSYPSSQDFLYSIVCDVINLNYTAYCPEVFVTPYYFSAITPFDFLFQARVTNIEFNMNSSQYVSVNFGSNTPSGNSGIDNKIFVGFYAPTGDIKLNIRGSSFFGLNQGGVFGSGNVNTANFTYTTASINVYDSSCIGVFSQSMGVPAPYTHPQINFYDKSLLAGRTDNCYFYDKSRVAPGLYEIQLYQPMSAPSFCIFVYSIFILTDFTNRNSAKSSF